MRGDHFCRWAHHNISFRFRVGSLFFPWTFLPAPTVGLCLSLTALACTSLVEMLMFADVENRDFEVGAWSIFWQDWIGQGSDALWQKSILFSFFLWTFSLALVTWTLWYSVIKNTFFVNILVSLCLVVSPDRLMNCPSKLKPRNQSWIISRDPAGEFPSWKSSSLSVRRGKGVFSGNGRGSSRKQKKTWGQFVLPWL